MTGIEIGSEMPVIRRSTQPFLNDRGLWSDLDITYNGGFRMCLETKVNLMKLRKMSSRTVLLESKGAKNTTKGSVTVSLFLSYTVYSKEPILGLTQEWFRELSFPRLECRVHDKFHIYPLCSVFYFPWHRHQIEGTKVYHPKDTEIDNL